MQPSTHLAMSVPTSLSQAWAGSTSIFLGATPAHQKVLLGSHEEYEAGAWLILSQRILQPLPGRHRGLGWGGDRLRDSTNHPQRPEKDQGMGADLGSSPALGALSWEVPGEDLDPHYLRGCWF